MSKFAIIALLPQPEDDKTRADFLSREFETAEEIGPAIAELEERFPRWQAVTIVHVEDLPLLMGQPDDPIGKPDDPRKERGEERMF